MSTTANRLVRRTITTAKARTE